MYGYEILHEDIVEKLIENVRMGFACHAYIFEGERGVGSLEAAKLMANAMVCEKSENAPCTTCAGCVLARAGNHPDISFIMPAEKKKNIQVDQIRNLVQDAYTKPYESKKKVYIIAYGDDMNEQAQNAFLKLLEEPPEYAVFILLAENHESLLQTIRSRCTLIRFGPVSDDIIREYLKRHFPDENEKFDFLVRYSAGIAGNAEKILNQDNFVLIRNLAFEHMGELLSDKPITVYNVVDFLEENKDDADFIIEFWLSFLRDMLLISCESRESILNSDMFDRISGLAVRYDEERLVKAISCILKAQKMRKRDINLRAVSLNMAIGIKE